MVSFLLKKGAIPFTDKEDKFIKAMLLIFRDHCQREGAFIHQVPLEKYHFLWSPYMLEHPDGIFGGIMGCWDPGTRWKIFLVPRSKDTAIRPSKYSIGDEEAISTGGYILLDCIATTAIHELTHAWQFSVNPVLWVINRLVTTFVEYIPFLKKITIEDDADGHISENKEVLEFFSELIKAWDNYIFVKRQELNLRRKTDEGADKEDLDCATEQLTYAETEFLSNPKPIQKAVIQLFEIMA